MIKRNFTLLFGLLIFSTLFSMEDNSFGNNLFENQKNQNCFNNASQFNQDSQKIPQDVYQETFNSILNLPEKEFLTLAVTAAQIISSEANGQEMNNSQKKEEEYSARKRKREENSYDQTNKNNEKKRKANPLKKCTLAEKLIQAGHIEKVGEREYKCCYCNAIFTKPHGGVLERHLSGSKTESNEKRKGHGVDLGKTFDEQDKASLIKMKGKIFTKKLLANGHYKKKDEKTFVCQYCGKEFYDPRNGKLKIHISGNGFGGSVGHNVDLTKTFDEQDKENLKTITKKFSPEELILAGHIKKEEDQFFCNYCNEKVNQGSKGGGLKTHLIGTRTRGHFGHNVDLTKTFDEQNKESLIIKKPRKKKISKNVLFENGHYKLIENKNICQYCGKEVAFGNLMRHLRGSGKPDNMAHCVDVYKSYDLQDPKKLRNSPNFKKYKHDANKQKLAKLKEEEEEEEEEECCNENCDKEHEKNDEYEEKNEEGLNENCKENYQEESEKEDSDNDCQNWDDAEYKPEDDEDIEED